MSSLPATVRLGALLCGFALAMPSTCAQTVVNAHSSWPEDLRRELARAAETAVSGVRIDWTRAEQAELLWGVPVRLLIADEREGRLEPYTPAGAARLRASFRSASSPMGWTGLTASAPAICYARGWAAAMGETAAARFVRALSANVVEARRAAAAVCQAVAEGYSAVGVGVTAEAFALAAHGANLQMIVPTPVAYDMDGSALRKGASEAARKLADFAVSRAAMTLYARNSLIVSLPGVPNTIDPVPPASSRDLETIDFNAEKPAAAGVLRAWQAAGKSAR